MNRLTGLKRLMRIDRTRTGIDRAVSDELEFHFDMTVSELMKTGMTPDDARREAHRRFGDVGRAHDHLTRIDRSRVDREQRAEWWNALGQDLRYAMRGLRLKPAFAIGVVITLGLGIGANAAMFGIVDRLLFRPPAFLIATERTHRVYFEHFVDGRDFIGQNAQYQRLLDFQRDSRSMEVLAAYSDARQAVGTGEAARELDVGAMTADVWKLFDARPVIGRFFTADEDRYPDVSRVAVLSYPYWQSHYAGSRDVIGKTIDVAAGQYTIIGVAPRGFSAFELVTPVVFIPLNASAADVFGARWAKTRNTYNLSWLKIYGRRKPGLSLDAANADLTAAFRRSYLAQVAMYPRSSSIEIAKPRAIVSSVLDERGPSTSADAKVAAWLLGVACIVLLIACANVGNLLLGRAVKRRREIAVRLALGVSRSRLATQLIVESLLLAAFGAAAGVAVAEWGGRVLRATLLPQVEWDNALADPRVLVFTGACTLVTGLLAGLAPIVQARRCDVAAELKAGPREGGGRRSRMRTALLLLQAALSVVLLVGAGLFARSVQHIQMVHLGYDADHLVWVRPHLRGTTLDSMQRTALGRSMIDRAFADPSVANASLVLSVPFSSTEGVDMFVPDVDTAAFRWRGDLVLQGSSPSYFATTGTRILRGRGFEPNDREHAALVAVVSSALAKGLWPNEDAVGKCVRIETNTSPCRTVVGVADDIKFWSLGEDEPNLMLYLPIAQTEGYQGTMYVRTRRPADAQTDAIRREIQSVMPGAAYVTAQPLTSVLNERTRSWRLGATMFAVFGGLALVLAAIGLYSVIAYSVAERTHEMGVRIALGAQAREVITMVVRDGLRVVGVGIVIGASIAIAAGHWLAPLLFRVSPRDPLVYGAVSVVLVAVAVAAGWLPALRASRVDPAIALRAD